MATFYPIALNMDGRTAVVIGGGAVGERKVCGLRERGIAVRLVSPRATRALMELAIRGEIEWRARKALEEDLDGAALVFLATDDAQVNAQLAEAARRRGLPVNRADDPDGCDFIVPASFRSGNIEVAVFSGGEAPFFARWLRQRLEQELSHVLGDLGALMAQLRAELKGLPISQQERASLLNSVLESDVLEVLRSEGKEAALGRARELVAQARKVQ